MKFAPVGLVFLGAALSAVRAETAQFLLTGPVARDGTQQSYVVATEDPAKIQQARVYLRDPAPKLRLYARVKIATGADGINRNYTAPGQPAWDWHVTQFVDWGLFDPTAARTTDYVLARDGAPSNAPDILAGLGTPAIIDIVTGKIIAVNTDSMGLIFYHVTRELTTAPPSRFTNFSQRGFVGTGERVLIAGVAIDGVAPRRVVVRALGPSLRAFGVVDALADPRLEVYRGAERIAENDNWAGSLAVPNAFPLSAATFRPANASEPAVELTLVPGNYTVVVRGTSDTTGVALIEMFDVTPLD